MTGDYPPFSMRTPAGGFDGFDVAVARLFAHDTGRRLQIVATRWPDLVGDLRAGAFDVAMGGVTIRPERAMAGTFTRPVARAGAVVLARPGSPRSRIGVNAGGHLERVARRLFPDSALVTTTDNRSLPGLLAAGSVDAILTDEVEVVVIAGNLPGMRRLGPLTRDRKAYLGRNPSLAAELDRWLRARENDGTLAALRARWLADSAVEVPSAGAADLEALLAAIDLRLAFMPAVAAAKRATGLPVEDAAQEARVLAAARERAVEWGLAPEPVEALFRAIIAAARAVQHAFLARPWPVEAMDLETEIRPALARVSDEIVARARDVAAVDAAGDLAPEDVADRLDPSWASPEARVAIATAIANVRLADDGRREQTFVKAGRVR